MPLRRFRSIRSSPRGGTPLTRARFKQAPRCEKLVAGYRLRGMRPKPLATDPPTPIAVSRQHRGTLNLLALPGRWAFVSEPCGTFSCPRQRAHTAYVVGTMGGKAREEEHWQPPLSPSG